MVMRPYSQFENDEPELYRQVMEYIPLIEGKPFLRICGFDASCFLGTRMYELRIFEAQLEGKTDWAVPIEDYPEELWDSFWIAYDCLQIRQDYIVDNYFKYYYIFRSDWIARARQDDLDFVDDFLLTKNV